jgi:hypothetical protein
MGLVVSLLLATPAAAQGGGGLYEPFPEPAPTDQVRAFISKLPGGDRAKTSRLSGRELEHGEFPSPELTASTGTGAASRRAGVGTGAAFLDGWPAALAAVLLAGAGAAALARRRA